MHPYRVAPESPPPEPPAGMPSEDRFLIGLLILIGGVRVFFGVLAGTPWDGETTIALGGLALGVWWGMQGLWPFRRGGRRRSGKLHDGEARDRARGTMRP